MNARQILEEMGYTLWTLRAAHGTSAGTDPGAPKAERASGPAREHPAPAIPTPAHPLTKPAQNPGEAASGTADTRTNGIARMGWEELEAAIRECRACELCRRRQQAVPGVGDRNADWLFVGEGPGAEEDARGEPFVGQAGKLLDAMLAAIGMKRGDRVYIANAVKCRPEGNRTPHAEEMNTCFPFLERQIALVRPKIIVLLGKAAVHSVLKEEKALAALRKKCFFHDGIPVVVTYHPAYLLRNLPEKAKAWEDLCFARHTLGEPG
jgi:DNA polymerase